MAPKVINHRELSPEEKIVLIALTLTKTPNERVLLAVNIIPALKNHFIKDKDTIHVLDKEEKAKGITMETIGKILEARVKRKLKPAIWRLAMENDLTYIDVANILNSYKLDEDKKVELIPKAKRLGPHFGLEFYQILPFLVPATEARHATFIVQELACFHFCFHLRGGIDTPPLAIYGS